MSGNARTKKRIRLTPFGYLVVAASVVVILIAVCLIAKAAGKKRLSNSSVDGSGNPLNSAAGELNTDPGALDGIINVASAATNEPTAPATPTPVPTPVPTPTIYFAASDALTATNYSNKDFLYSLFEDFYGAEGMPYGCKPVFYDSQILENLTMGTARVYTAVIMLIPVAIAVVGAVVIIRRKNR